jgi:delta 1-pyrroline-5-carboxylate dehydrogenase
MFRIWPVRVWVSEIGAGCEYELQRLHGMGAALYAALQSGSGGELPVRVYAPVGSHEELLPYLVRRLLENGAKNSFVNALNDPGCSIESLIEDPCERIRRVKFSPHPRIPLPGDLYGDERSNSQGVAAVSATSWNARGGAGRAAVLKRAAELIEQQMPELMAMIVREGGRTLPDALSEVREAVDFCRYYAHRAGEEFERPRSLPGATGEKNTLALHGRGVFACISPWNFPLAIFTGQVAAALAARGGPIIPLIAETGGQNVMIADSSALVEQLVSDVIQSAFNSAGQRCSALRVLFVQESIAERTEKMLVDAMDELRMGDPMKLSTDIGPLIDQAALQGLNPHIERMNREARCLKRIAPPLQILPAASVRYMCSVLTPCHSLNGKCSVRCCTLFATAPAVLMR